MTEELYQSIRPFVCARGLGELTEFNINTATPLDAFVLSSLMGVAAPALANFPTEEIALEQIIFEPKKLWVEAQVNYRNASRVVVFEFDGVDNEGANLTYRGWGGENLRPTIQSPNSLNEVSN